MEAVAGQPHSCPYLALHMQGKLACSGGQGSLSCFCWNIEACSGRKRRKLFCRMADQASKPMHGFRSCKPLEFSRGFLR